LDQEKWEGQAKIVRLVEIPSVALENKKFLSRLDLTLK
jgi:hypothetical protein